MIKNILQNMGNILMCSSLKDSDPIVHTQRFNRHFKYKKIFEKLYNQKLCSCLCDLENILFTQILFTWLRYKNHENQFQFVWESFFYSFCYFVLVNLALFMLHRMILKMNSTENPISKHSVWADFFLAK